jgi:beta-1,4-mannosyl-glycoprotein beta-1,4-N-acetylglucosaminyltransferase
MIYDCFTFRDEIETLKMRLEILDSVVDKFVISEANKTHSNINKPFVFKEHESEFSKWADKIIYVQVELDDSELDFSQKDKEYTPSSPAWIFENTQRNSLDKGLFDLQDDDVVMIGDLDEIPNPNFLHEVIKKLNGQTHISLIQHFFYC